MIYGDPGSIIPLNIAVAPGGYDLVAPPGLPIAREIAQRGFDAVDAIWRFNPGMTFALSGGSALTGRIPLSAVGPAQGGPAGVALNRQSFLQSGPLGLDFGTTRDANSSQTPRRLRFAFRGALPAADGALLMIVTGWTIGGIMLMTSYGGNRLICSLSRGDKGDDGYTSSVPYRPGVEQLIELEWRDRPGEAGGTIAFFLDGKPAGGPFRTKIKPRITPDMALSINASLGNTRQAIDGMIVREIRLDLDRAVTRYSYSPVVDGPVSAELLASLVVDARRITAPQPPAKLAWKAADGGVGMLDIRIGPLDVPAGQPYKAVLVDWSSGAGVPHPNALVMTRIAAQNCRFEDDALGRDLAAWIECLPQGPVPNIAGIDYRCEAIRAGDYVQFQFGYDWDAGTMPNNPFGDPTGKRAYMVPHKWLIYDRDDRLLATIETPDGGPLNGTDKPYLFAGDADGRNCAVISPKDRWYPHGTVRSGIIWRNRDPAAHDPAAVRRAAPLFDLAIPFGSHLDYSVNGCDLRIFQGGSGEGQANGFGNVRVVPWEQSDYRTMVGQAGRTRDPFGALLYTANSMAANAALWMKYTPFNVQGRSPVTGLGGTRDDRQIIAEPVACYIDNPEGRRPHDGLPWRAIALDFLTGYVSDPIHAFEKGRNIPLYKGNARRAIGLRNHYYGGGDAGLPAAQGWYQQGGRLSDWLRGSRPLRVAVPSAGDTSATPYFGTFQIDKAHGHQFPGWGSLLFRTPEFAFLGHRFWDQNRLYSNDIIGDDGCALWSSREGGWAYMHAALAWKTASASSQRLYSRSEVLDFVIGDFERFHDRHYAANPGFLHPPEQLPVGGDLRLAVYAAARRFGVVGMGEQGIIQHDISVGYWLSALSAAEKLGFNAALRRSSAKAGAVLDWMIAMHRKRIVGRILGAARLQPIVGDYTIGVWGLSHIAAAGGRVAALPQDYAALDAIWGRAPSWDRYIDGPVERQRDGQAMDQIVAGPSLLRYLLGQEDAEVVAAQETANRWRAEKKAQELARGEQAGAEWFRYLQATNNPARAVQG